MSCARLFSACLIERGGSNQSQVICPLETKLHRAYLVYRIDEGLGVIPGELSDHFNLVVARNGSCDQGHAVVSGEGMADQSFPGRFLTAHGKEVSTNVPSLR